MFSVSSAGSFKNFEAFAKRVLQGDIFNLLERYGQMGVNALANATPVDTALTANSWRYEIQRGWRSTTISWHNDSMAGSVPVVILLQYGHGTGTGGYVQGRDFINPAAKPIFDKIASDVWKAVTK